MLISILMRYVTNQHNYPADTFTISELKYTNEAFCCVHFTFF